MGKSKDNRIRKLKKKRIWPSVLGLFLILLVSFAIIASVLAFACLDVVQRKLIESSNQSMKIAKLYEEYNETTKDRIQNEILSYIDLTTEVEVVGILDAEGQKKWSSNGTYPIKEQALEFEAIWDDKGTGILMIIEEDANQLLEIEDGVVSFSENVLDIIGYEKFFNFGNYFSEDESNSLIQLKIWFVIPANDMQVCVLNNIYVYAYDFFMLMVSMVLLALLIVVFALYYIISFISVIINMRRTTQIIYTDMVTGGNNWLHFVKKGMTLLKKNRGNKYKYAMVHLQMRKYRSFCTCLGVREGEELIEKFYHVLKKKINRKEAMAHRENAGFGLLLIYTDKQQLLERIKYLENCLDEVLPNMKLYFGVGIYQVGSAERDVEQLYNNALLAYEMLGEEAENQIAFFDVEMNKQRLWERRVEEDMDQALARKEFKVYLQPKISTTEEQLAGAEALVRWIHPTEGFIPPNKFIPIFEKNGFILKLDDYMLEEIAKQQAEWIAQGRKIVPISVNVSRAHFTREDLAEHISAIVDRYHVPHNVIELELTESAFFDDREVLLNTVRKLRSSGFIVSMDDFGAGYSSLNSLKELHIDVLKIDADFFRGKDVGERGMLIVSEVIDLAKKLNMKIVAEGIENREQVDFLIEQECDLIQGYFFAKPMPIEEFVEKYKES